MKGINIWISFIIVIAISISAITIVMTGILPAYKSFKESAALAEGINTLKLIDSRIKHVVAEGVGAARRFPISITGEYFVDSKRDTIEFLLTSETGIMEPGTFVERDGIKIVAGFTAQANQNSTHLVLENDLLRVVFNNISGSFFGIINETFLKVVNLAVNLTNSSIIFDDNPSLSVTPVTSRVVKVGSKLPKAEAVFNSSNYTLSFTLPPLSDYLILRATGPFSNFTFNIFFHLGVNSTDDEIYVHRIGKNASINFTSGCWDARSLYYYFICSTDSENTQLFPLIHLGPLVEFGQLCFENRTANNYYMFNLTTSGRIAIGHSTMRNCENLDRNKIIERNFEQKISPSIGEVVAKEVKKYQIAAFIEYDKIDIANDAVLRAGMKALCIRYAGIVNKKPAVEVVPC